MDATGHFDLSHKWCKSGDIHLHANKVTCVSLPTSEWLWTLHVLLQREQ